MATSERSCLLLASPSTGLVDDVISIKATGLSHRHDVTLAGVLEDAGRVFVSHAHYVTDSHGSLDVSRDSSLAGSYTGVERMGLLWSMKPADGQQKGLRLVKHDVMNPIVIDLYVIDGHVTVTSKQHINDAPKIHATSRIYRYYQAEGVKAVKVKDGNLRGMLFIPPGEGPFPGVIDMFGTAGGLMQFRSALLASRGFVTFALPYFDYEDLPRGMDLKLDYFEEAVDWLYNHPSVLKTSGGVGVIGVSKGASLAAEMAIMNSKVKAVVFINGACIHHTGFHSYKGVPRPVFNPSGEELDEGFVLTDEGYTFIKAHRPKPSNMDASIEIEKATGTKFLFVFGGDDPSNTFDNVTILIERLKRHGLESNYRLLSYPKAGHLIEPPYSPHCRVAYTKIMGTTAVYGGETKAHSDAQELAWAETLAFFRQHLTVDASSNANKTLNAVTNSKL